MRVFAAVFATALVAAVGAGAWIGGATAAAFALFALLTVGGASVCLLARSGAHSVCALLASFLGTAGLFLLLGSDFLAMAQVLICAGGIVALFLFGVLLAPQAPDERSLSRIGAALFVLAPLGAFLAWRCVDVAAFTRSDPGVHAAKSAERIGVALLDPARYAVVFEVAAVILTVAMIAAAYFARGTPAAPAAPEEAQ